MSIFKKTKKIKSSEKEIEKKEIVKEIDEKKIKTKKEEKPKLVHGSAFLIKQAWISEKSTDLSALGKYIFIVNKKANKSEIKKAIESIYKVKVKSVNMINVKSKEKRLGRSLGKTSAFKKAIVTLKPGEKIDIMPV
ncbi:50S ribosomal protein L23 [Candidatus Wolfebacteria bacterium]|nr:50S ribosomal protein L23 [Candidatus Wolfebacteria bacterium]